MMGEATPTPWEEYSLPLAFRIIGYGCLLFVAGPCWVGLVLDWITR